MSTTQVAVQSSNNNTQLIRQKTKKIVVRTTQSLLLAEPMYEDVPDLIESADGLPLTAEQLLANKNRRLLMQRNSKKKTNYEKSLKVHSLLTEYLPDIKQPDNTAFATSCAKKFIDPAIERHNEALARADKCKQEEAALDAAILIDRHTVFIRHLHLSDPRVNITDQQLKGYDVEAKRKFKELLTMIIGVDKLETEYAESVGEGDPASKRIKLMETQEYDKEMDTTLLVEVVNETEILVENKVQSQPEVAESQQHHQQQQPPPPQQQPPPPQQQQQQQQPQNPPQTQTQPQPQTAGTIVLPPQANITSSTTVRPVLIAKDSLLGEGLKRLMTESKAKLVSEDLTKLDNLKEEIPERTIDYLCLKKNEDENGELVLNSDVVYLSSAFGKALWKSPIRFNGLFGLDQQPPQEFFNLMKKEKISKVEFPCHSPDGKFWIILRWSLREAEKTWQVNIFYRKIYRDQTLSTDWIKTIMDNIKTEKMNVTLKPMSGTVGPLISLSRDLAEEMQLVASPEKKRKEES